VNRDDWSFPFEGPLHEVFPAVGAIHHARRGFDAARDLDDPDTEMPDTEMPDTEMPDTEMPDTEMPDTEMPDTEMEDDGDG